MFFANKHNIELNNTVKDFKSTLILWILIKVWFRSTGQNNLCLFCYGSVFCNFKLSYKSNFQRSFARLEVAGPKWIFPTFLFETWGTLEEQIIICSFAQNNLEKCQNFLIFFPKLKKRVFFSEVWLIFLDFEQKWTH